MVQIGANSSIFGYNPALKEGGTPVRTHYVAPKPPEDLQTRLERIDAGEPTVFSPGNTLQQPQGNDDIMARLDALDRRELKPHTDSNFDLTA